MTDCDDHRAPCAWRQTACHDARARWDDVPTAAASIAMESGPVPMETA